MSITQKITYLLCAMLSIVFLPWLGSFIYYHGHFPPDFFAYPPLTPMHKDSSFNIYIFTFVALGCAMLSALYLFPQLFGFKKLPVQKKEVPKVGWPIWFWLGLLAWGVAIFYLATKEKTPLWFIHWSDLPLFWGFTLMLDGWVYKRNGGKSFVSVIPQELVGIGVASVSGWMIFEFLNFFIDDNWYYPCGNIIDREEFLLYACIISSGLLPLALEWYCVFKTFPKLNHRFSAGKKIVFSEGMKNIVMLLSLASIFCTGLFPDYLFFTLWVAPPIIIAIALDKIGVWTPLKPIGKGDWSPTLLSALTYLFAGFGLECQNYFSAVHTVPVWSEDPAYWQYSLPFVNVLHVFEMPLLGFFGYLPFGTYCLLWWIACATLLNIRSELLKENPLDLTA